MIRVISRSPNAFFSELQKSKRLSKMLIILLQFETCKLKPLIKSKPVRVTWKNWHLWCLTIFGFIITLNQCLKLDTHISKQEFLNLQDGIMIYMSLKIPRCSNRKCFLNVFIIFSGRCQKTLVMPLNSKTRDSRSFRLPCNKIFIQMWFRPLCW